MPEAIRAAENAPSAEEMQAEFTDRCGLTSHETDMLNAMTRDERVNKWLVNW